MAIDKNGKELPKGLTWLEKKQLYMARFTYQGTSYTLYAKTLKEAKKKLADKKYEVEHGLTGRNDKITLDKWFEIWLNEYKGTKLKNTTLNNYQTIYNNHVRKTLGKRQLSQIKPIHLQKLYNDTINSGYSTSSVQTLNALLHNLFQVAADNDLIIKNPCISGLRPKGNHTERRVLSADEQAYLLNFIQQDNFSYCEPTITTFLGTGLRIGELLALTWDDVDFVNKTISVNKTLVYIKNRETGKFGFELQTPKTLTSKRLMPLSDNVIRALKKQRRNQNFYKISGNWKPYKDFDDLVFAGKNGRPQQTVSIQYMLNKVVKAINNEEIKKAQAENREPQLMEHLHPHALRHSFATRCFEADIPPKTVQLLMGHANIQITLDLYTHVSEQKKLKDLQKLDSLFTNVV